MESVNILSFVETLDFLIINFIVNQLPWLSIYLVICWVIIVGYVEESIVKYPPWEPLIILPRWNIRFHYYYYYFCFYFYHKLV
jgi:hypothetical protein